MRYHTPDKIYYWETIVDVTLYFEYSFKIHSGTDIEMLLKK